MAKEKEVKMSEEELKLRENLLDNFYKIVERVIVSEKSTRFTEFENKLVFEVVRDIRKPLLKILIEEKFKKKIRKINVINAMNNKKRAIISFKEEGAASDISSELGLI